MKLTSSILLLFILLLSGCGPFEHQKNDLEKINDFLGGAAKLIDTTLKTFQLDNEMIIVIFVKDRDGHTYIVYEIDGAIQSSAFMPNRPLEGNSLHWKYDSYRQIPLLAGKIFDKSIVKITVEGLNSEEDIRFIEFEGDRYFISTSKNINTEPITIRGLTENGELIK